MEYIEANFSSMISDKIQADVANILRKTFREYDVLIDYEDYEFISALFCDHDEDMNRILLRLQNNVKHYNIKNKQNDWILELEFGYYSETPHSCGEIDILIQKARQNMKIESKRS